MRHFSTTSNILITFLLATGLGAAMPAVAATLPASYPRLANYYLNPDMTREQADQLAQWDMVVLGIELQYTHPEILQELRKKNPDIILLAYVPSEEIPATHLALTDPNHPHYQLLHDVAESWWLADHAGHHVSYWPGTQMLNVTDGAPIVNGERWNTYLPQFVHDHVMATGMWDGIFYDNVWPAVSWVNNGDVDMNGDGIADTARTADTAWRAGMQTLLDTSRTLEGKNAIIIGNGGGEYYAATNGRLIEDFPSTEDGGWSGAMQKYINVMERGLPPTVVIVNGKSATGTQDDLPGLRFALTSTLLENGFFSFDDGAQRHSDLWWYDEYSAFLGKPLSNAKNITQPKARVGTTGVWWRDFQNGIVLANATDAPQKVDLLDGYETVAHARGTSYELGQVVNAITLQPHDGMLLLKRHFSIGNGGFLNGAFTRTFRPDGQPTRQGFFTYDNRFTGGVTITKQSDAQQTVQHVVVTEGMRIRVYDQQGILSGSFAPFGTQAGSGMTASLGDVDGDGQNEIVAAAGMGASPLIRMFSLKGKPLGPAFFAYNRGFRGGVFVTVADVDGDGKAEIVTGAGQGGGPLVSVFRSNGKVRRRFFAYPKGFRGGVRVASGDLDGDGKAEIVTGPGPGGTPQIRIFSKQGDHVVNQFYALPKTFRNGLFPSVADFDQDHRTDILISLPNIY